MAKRKDGPHWVKAWISDLSALTDKFRDLETGAVDFTELGKEEYRFRMALSRKDFTLSERAKKVWEEAVGPYQQRVNAACKCNEDSNQNSGSAKPSTDGDTRKDSLELTHAGNSVLLESGTSVENSYAQALDSLPDKASDQGEDNTANIVPGDDGPEPGNLSGDALDGDTSDGDSTLSTEGLADRTTVSKNMRRVPQNEAPAHGFSGGRTAQGTMSRSPEAAAQSGKAYDQGTIEISTDDQKRTGGHSPLSQSPSSRPPVRHVDVTVQEKKPYGANLAVMLTDDEGRKLREIYGENLEMAIDILDSYIANGGKSARKYRSHFSVMRRGNWVWNKVNETLIAERRLSNEEKPRQRYMTADDISRRNAEEGWRQLQLMKGANEA